MDEIIDLRKALSEWRQESNSKKITDVLKRLNKISDLPIHELTKLMDLTTLFHKQIVKQDNIDTEWFEYCLRLKKKLKRMVEIHEKKKTVIPQINTINKEPLEYPEILTAGKTQKQEKALKYLFKSLMTNMGDDDRQTGAIFVIKLFASIRELLEDQSDNAINCRIDEVCIHFLKQSCVSAKKNMLKGIISAIDVAKNTQQVYQNQQIKLQIAKNMAEQVQANKAGFYAEMKKEINKNSTGQCIFCHKKAAYIEDEKQIRASDEPMTRFMKCNNCGKGWKD